MGMRERVLAIIFLLGLPICHARAGQPVTIGILEFVSKGGVSQEQVDQLADSLAKEIGRQGNYRVVGQTDVFSLLDLENQKCLSDCTDECCFAWIGSAMGARWTITGNVSRFGSVHVLNLKLIDVMSAKVVGRISRRVKGGQSDLHGQLSETVKDLLSKLKNAPPSKPATRTSTCARACKEESAPHCTDLACLLRKAAAATRECTMAPSGAIMELSQEDLNLVLWRHDPRSFEAR